MTAVFGRPPDKRGVNPNQLSYFLTKTYAVGTQRTDSMRRFF